MGSFKLGRMTMRSLLGKPATAMYPVVPPVYFERTKGHVENDIETCILCSICEKKCPSQAIVVDKPAKSWTIDPFRCVQCNACVIACPKQCLTMVNTYTAPATSKSTLTVTKAEAAS
ncbi:MAG: 4Fe-4S dicluster domain-containing protein [Coriobacteriia bacterium]|nr:4Fe-4S dicluster domain-containing protein [Coriobacteriia bacterium]